MRGRGPDPAAGSPRLPSALAKNVPAARLRQVLPDLTAAGASMVAEAAAPTPSALFRLLVAGQNLPTASSIAGAPANLPEATLEAWFESPQLTARAVRIQRHIDRRAWKKCPRKTQGR